MTAISSMDLKSRLQSKQARIGIIGLGYVGLPVAVAFARSGVGVVGFDIDIGRVAELRRGHDRTHEVDSADLTLAGLSYETDPKQIAASFAGREFDESLLADLPPGADPCGERGEFHTFAYAGPMFRHPIPIEQGQIVTRDGFVFADLLPSI